MTWSIGKFRQTSPTLTMLSSPECATKITSASGQAAKELGLLGDNDHNGCGDAGSSLAIVSLSTDPGALAIGPQLARSPPRWALPPPW
jgi:hypothetical protein